MNTLQWNNQKISIISSDKDIASVLIANELETLSLPVFHLQDKHHLYVTDKDLPEADCFIFLSRHSSAAGEPAFTVHSLGNFSPEEPKLGGLPSQLSKTNTDIQTYLLYSIKQNLTPEFSSFDVIAEATHHGPNLSKPALYIEMGSTSEVWSSQKAANLLAKSIQYFFHSFKIPDQPPIGAIGFGGGHYPRKIAEKMLNLEFSVGHLCPKYNLAYIDDDMVDQMIINSYCSTGIKIALFDKKGMNRKKEIRDLVTSKGLEVLQI